MVTRIRNLFLYLSRLVSLNNTFQEIKTDLTLINCEHICSVIFGILFYYLQNALQCSIEHTVSSNVKYNILTTLLVDICHLEQDFYVSLGRMQEILGITLDNIFKKKKTA